MSTPEDSSPKPLPPGRTQYIPIAKIVIPAHARAHPEERIRAMAEDLKANDLIQEITVTPNGDDTFELVAGCRRLRGATLAGWEQIRCSVREGLFAMDKLRLMFRENQDRDDASPFYQAALIEEMLAQPDVQQKDVALALGMDEPTISRYRVIARVPEDLKLELARANFSFSQLRELIRIENPDQFRALAKKAVAEGLSSRALAGVVTNLLKGSRTSEKRASSKAKEASKDPYASQWKSVPNPGAWKVAYQGKNRWAFYVSTTSTDSKSELGRWFGSMRDSLFGKSDARAESGQPPQPAVATPPAAPEPLAPDAVMPHRPTLPTPVISEATYIKGNKLQLRWTPLGEGFKYRVFHSVGDADADPPRFQPMENGEIGTPAAIVNLYAGVNPRRFVAITALDAQGHESELSKPIQFDLQSWNEENTVEPYSGPEPQ